MDALACGDIVTTNVLCFSAFRMEKNSVLDCWVIRTDSAEVIQPLWEELVDLVGFLPKFHYFCSRYF